MFILLQVLYLLVIKYFNASTRELFARVQPGIVISQNTTCWNRLCMIVIIPFVIKLCQVSLA